jgi:regulatory protein
MMELNQLKQKMARFCAWRERCTGETIEKLRESGAGDKQIKDVIRWLTEENYLNDERFARSFVTGKFSNNHWGKQKILAELHFRNIHKEIINDAINLIDDETYLAMAVKLAGKKWADIREDDLYIKKQKTAAYLAGKGYEASVAWQAVQKLQNPVT